MADWSDYLRQMWQYAGQVPAGAVASTVANSARPKETGITINGYRPAIVDSIPATYGAVKSLVTGQAPEAGSYIANSMERAGAASDKTNRALGIHDPENAAQTALNIAGSLLVPGPKLKVPTSAIGKVARVAAEVALPMRQTGIKTALKSAVPVGVALREGIDHVANSNDYHHVGEKQAPVDEFPDQLDTEFPDNLQMSEFPDQLAPASALSADNQSMSTAEKGVLGALALAGAGLGGAVVMNGLKKIRSVPDLGADLSGTRVIKPRDTSIKTKLQTGVLQADQPARNAASEFLTPDEAKQFNYSSDRIVNQAIGAKVSHAIKTGELPNSTVVAKPLAPILQAVSKDLDPTEFNMVSDGLLAKSALDDVTRTGVQAAFNDKSPQELRSLADAVDNDPKLAKYAGAVREQYSTLLSYMHDQGLISADSFAQMKKDRPNYVHMSKDVVREGGPDALQGGTGAGQVDELFARANEEFGGVQVGAARNPIDELQNRYASIIKLAETNSHKRDFLDKLSQGAAGEMVVASDGKQIPLIKEIDGAPKTTEGVIKVWDQGRARYYKIGDPALERSLQYGPVAQAPNVLRQMRQISQFFTTGAGNLTSFFGATVSPVYDTLSGMVLRPAGTDLGVINETLNRLGSPVNLGRLDPTAIVTAPIGALRNMKDELTGSLATSLSDQLIRDHGWILDTLGPQKTGALRDYLQNAYDNSIRSMLDANGVGSLHTYGGDSGMSIGSGMEHIAPDYFRAQADRATAEAMRGNPSWMEARLANGQNTFAKIKASTISRMYTGVLRNMQEGFRYQFAATNLPKVKSQADLNELMSTTRRVAVDSAQHGGSNAWNQIADSVMYSNLGTQALGEWGRRIAKNPVHTTVNLLTTIGTLAALRYGAILSDPAVAQKTADKTDMQNTSTITTFGGTELPVEPLLRMITGPLFAALDQISGVADGVPDPQFAKAIYKYFDDDDHDKAQEEELGASVKDSFMAGLQAANPISASGVPILAAAEASQGIDPSMTRITGEAMMQKPQSVDPLAGEGKTTDSLTTTYWDNIIQSVVGSGVTDWIRTVDDYQRAAFARNADGSRAISPVGAAKVALSRVVDNAARTQGPVQGMLFGGYTRQKSITDTDYNLMQAKRDGMDKAKAILNQNLLNPFVTGTDPRTAMMKPIDVVPPDLTGTQLAPIGAITAQLMKQIRPMQARSGQISKAIEEVKAGQKITSIEDRNKQVNDLNDERKYISTMILRAQRLAEDQIEQTIGEDFTYQHFDPERYRKPFVPASNQTQ